MMCYKPLGDILVELDMQQRRELAALAGTVPEAELQRRREARRELAAISVFFIERSWEILAPGMGTFSLEAESGKSPEELRDYLASLRQRHPGFAWAWTRARMNAWLMQALEICVPDLLQQHPEQAADYTDCLRPVDHYWFRQTPLHHLKAGYHTALGVACKWYGSAFELAQDIPDACPDLTRRFHQELRLFASFSLTMLTRTDRYLWDSAAAQPLDAVVEDGILKVARKAMEELALESAPDYGIRLGCPALRARRDNGLPAFAGLIAWVEKVFSHYLLEEKEPEP